MGESNNGEWNLYVPGGVVTHLCRLHRTLNASRLEWWIEYELAYMQLPGVIDRLEERPDGSWILTDYRTGPRSG